MRTHFTSSDLKLIAMGTMAVDHTAVFMIYVNGYGEFPVLKEIGTAMRLFGRVAFPLYAFMLVQGFLYTKDWLRYLERLAVLAVISEIPFNLVASGCVFYPEGQNTVWLLLIGLLALKGISAAEGIPAGAEGISAEARGRRFFLQALILAVAVAAAEITRADYGAFGVLFILTLYLFRQRPAERFFSGACILLLMEGTFYGLAAWIAFFFINRYNGERGRNLGRLPYLFYPAHLLIIYAAGVCFL